ncbi:MAG: aminopeptidase [Chloroflexi bacterium]|nr:aminopeptidase [Chloroflexota bacterium]
MEQTNAIRLIASTCMRVKPDDHILVVADDYARSQSIGQAVAIAARELGATVVYMVVAASHVVGQEPSKVTAGAMKSADAIFAVGERVIPVSGHSTAGEEVVRKGTRFFAAIGLSEDYLRRPVSLSDLVEMKERTERIVDLYNQADSIRLTTAQGTEITMSIKGRHGTPMHPLRGILVPDYAEAPVPPVEGSANGTLVYDGEMDGWGYTLAEPLVLKVVDGKVVDISGSLADAERLKKIAFADEGASNIGEFAIGTSHTVPSRLTGNRYDCAILGSAHIGLGRNTLLGGTTMSRIHIDGLMARATVEIDGKTIVRDGEVLV